MLTIAEIADKMPTIGGMWGFSGFMIFVLVGIAFMNRWVALVATAIALLVSSFWALCVYHECFRDALQQAIWSELGWTWVMHSFASSIAPFVATLIATIVKWRLETPRLRVQRRLCPACAYPVGTNARCTECGTPLFAKTA